MIQSKERQLLSWDFLFLAIILIIIIINIKKKDHHYKTNF